MAEPKKQQSQPPKAPTKKAAKASATKPATKPKASSSKQAAKGVGAAPKSRKGVGGRPSKFTKDMLELAELSALAGMTDEQIAKKLKIDVATLYRWKVNYPEFCEALKRTKVPIDDRVEATLLQRALGYEEEDVKIFQYEGVPVLVPYTKRVQPDVTAQIFWLKNRRPQTWRDKHEVEHSGNLGVDLWGRVRGQAEGR